MIFTTELPHRLSSVSHFTFGVVDCGDRVFKSSADEDYGGETFAGHEGTDMA